jgi:putative phosphoesterase
MARIGLISDTHGLLRPEALAFLAGADRIVHAGDIGHGSILDALRRIAPVIAVRGNNDRDAWARELPERARTVIEGIALLVVHDAAELAHDPPGPGTRVVVAGHSHKPSVVERHGILYVNPGSAGPRRFTLPIAAGELTIDGGHVSARTVTLVVR